MPRRRPEVAGVEARERAKDEEIEQALEDYSAICAPNADQARGFRVGYRAALERHAAALAGGALERREAPSLEEVASMAWRALYLSSPMPESQRDAYMNIARALRPFMVAPAGREATAGPEGGEGREEYVGTPCRTMEECPTYYDGCNCTVEQFRFALSVLEAVVDGELDVEAGRSSMAAAWERVVETRKAGKAARPTVTTPPAAESAGADGARDVTVERKDGVR